MSDHFGILCIKGLTVIYFRKTFHLRCLIGFRIYLWILARNFRNLWRFICKTSVLVDWILVIWKIHFFFTRFYIFIFKAAAMRLFSDLILTVSPTKFVPDFRSGSSRQSAAIISQNQYSLVFMQLTLIYIKVD